ncbi:dj-1 family [Fusarium pseudoanthophilum]|uniref:Dj-1 family n=1 Tax=Fusarium pseudoanthophilum TaxID=48495 RepID=A0A8H5KT77_9HYPO|nr:dj-1 family [Fusarium pseudoanthophilum]
MAPIHVGALVYDYQAIDVLGPTDLLHSASKEYLQSLSGFMKIELDTISRAPEFVFHHIGITRETLFLQTSNIPIVPTTTVDECPEIDCLLLGGPDPANFELHPKYAEFIQKHVAAGKLLFTTCTGAIVAAAAGCLDGKNATVNHGAVQPLRLQFPDVKWTDEKKWIIDGNTWTAAGAVAGMDMFAHWIKENFGMDIMVLAASMLDYEPRDVDGILNVIPKRYDENGKQLQTHVFK